MGKKRSSLSPREGVVDGVFPLEEEAEDFAGRRRHFMITCHPTPVGYTVRAVEEAEGDSGYEFRAYSETTSGAALCRVREKMYRGLATRHLGGCAGNYHLTHDIVRGRITWSGEPGVGLVVVGQPLSLDELGSLLATYEGWNVELRLINPLS